ncbi:uncharacterized protein [Watersipora subatra]|uniref:uncharacterized protein n=1 Tax=Watersipora subatra TaxID=2589382 RepID=UPI00355BF84A
MTKVQRENAIIGSAVGGAVIIILIIVSCVVFKIKSRKSKQQTAFSSRAGKVQQEPVFDDNSIPPNYKLPSYTESATPNARTWTETSQSNQNPSILPGYEDRPVSNVNPPKVTKKQKSSKKAKDMPSQKLPHVMISYQWDVKTQVLQFKERLSQAGFRVWIDVEQMHKAKDTFEAMAHAIDDAAVVVPVLTSKYQESVNCRKEIQYADKADKPIVPVRLEKKFKPTKWLSFLLGNTLWHDLSKPETFEDSFTNFLDAIRDSGEAALAEERKDDEEENDVMEDSSSKTLD